jgi:hypothetical protein
MTAKDDQCGVSSVPVRVAFYGRVASGDDDSALLPILFQSRRVAQWVATLPEAASVVEWFADVGAWNGLRDSRVRTYEWSLDGHRVAGGLKSLLERARHRDRAFDLVVCVRHSVLSRSFRDLRHIEHTLARSGVRTAYTDQVAIAPPIRPGDAGICALTPHRPGPVGASEQTYSWESR